MLHSYREVEPRGAVPACPDVPWAVTAFCCALPSLVLCSQQEVDGCAAAGTAAQGTGTILLPKALLSAVRLLRM